MNRAKLPTYVSKFVAINCSLIFLVKQNPALYNFCDASFHDPEAKKSAWKRIEDELNKPKQWCMQKWRTLRSGYIKWKLLSKNGIKWPYSSAMSFLDDFITEVSFPPPPLVLSDSSVEEESYWGDDDDDDDSMSSSDASTDSDSAIREMELLTIDEDVEPEQQE